MGEFDALKAMSERSEAIYMKHMVSKPIGSPSMSDQHIYVVCPVCKGIAIVDFPGVPGRKWHGFPENQGHYFNLLEATILEQSAPDFGSKVGD